jgi:SAM-dependent methyltransferase
VRVYLLIVPGRALLLENTMKAEFDQYASRYSDLSNHPLREAFGGGAHFLFERKWIIIREFQKHFGVPRSDSWLDLGCGTGELLRLGRDHFTRVSGCDPAAAMLECCRDLDVRPQQSPIRVPFEDASFDLITAVCVYHHLELEERLPLTRDAARALKPGGVFCVIEHNPYNPATQYLVRHIPVDANARILTAGAVRSLMREAGLKILATRYFLYFPAFLHRRLGAVEDLLASVPIGGQYAVFAQKP